MPIGWIAANGQGSSSTQPCDTSMQEEVDELGVSHANKTCEHDLQTLKSSANHQPSPFKLENG
ncbi:UNVERIFIED_ORG: hypothetical protein J2W82_003540 [Pseudomonas mohnii]|jgi:hypothetical protein|nr:hypothetical protein [Pseudomonas mohnii]